MSRCGVVPSSGHLHDRSCLFVGLFVGRSGVSCRETPDKVQVAPLSRATTTSLGQGAFPFVLRALH